MINNDVLIQDSKYIANAWKMFTTLTDEEEANFKMIMKKYSLYDLLNNEERYNDQSNSQTRR